jgi:hypothetical protein
MIYQGQLPPPAGGHLAAETVDNCRAALSANADTRGCGGRRLAGGDAGALEAQGEFLVDRVRNVSRLVCGGKGESSSRDGEAGS